jgi:hypothetical protein
MSQSFWSGVLRKVHARHDHCVRGTLAAGGRGSAYSSSLTVPTWLAARPGQLCWENKCRGGKASPIVCVGCIGHGIRDVATSQHVNTGHLQSNFTITESAAVVVDTAGGVPEAAPVVGAGAAAAAAVLAAGTTAAGTGNG